jgi:uracil-DNA glycosylase
MALMHHTKTLKNHHSTYPDALLLPLAKKAQMPYSCPLAKFQEKTKTFKPAPLVSQSGILLDRALLAAGINREDIFITNIVKCRPPDNQMPLLKEIYTGKRALQNIKVPWLPLQHNSLTTFPVFHPAYALRN